MTIPEIIAALINHSETLPREAIRAAIDQREAVTPELLRAMEAIADNPEHLFEAEGECLPVFALYVLAQFREARAYEPIVKMLHAPGEIPFDFVGGSLFADLGMIFASVYNGDPVPLQGLIENPDASEDARGAALRALGILVQRGQLPRETAAGYFRALFEGKLERQVSWVWSALVSEAAGLQDPGFLPEIRRAYVDDLVDAMWATFDEVEAGLCSGDWNHGERQDLVTDAIADLEWWETPDWDDYPVSEKAGAGPDSPEGSAADSAQPYVPPVWQKPVPIVKGPKIGRNDPCPCGSGKKYKKCCGKG